MLNGKKVHKLEAVTFTFAGTNVPPKQVPPDIIGSDTLLHPGLCAAQHNCDWFKDIQNSQLFFPYSRVTMGAARPFLAAQNTYLDESHII